LDYGALVHSSKEDKEKELLKELWVKQWETYMKVGVF
jgi:hypothetical protein